MGDQFCVVIENKEVANCNFADGKEKLDQILTHNSQSWGVDLMDFEVWSNGDRNG